MSDSAYHVVPYLGTYAEEHFFVHLRIQRVELELEVLHHQPYVALDDKIVALVLDFYGVEELSLCGFGLHAQGRDLGGLVLEDVARD